MKLFFDARYIETSLHNGISRYSTEMARALVPLHKDTTFIICDDKQKELLPLAAKTIRIHKPTSPKEPFTAFVLNKYHPDVVFSPMQTMGSLGRRFGLILTLHDLIYYHYRIPPHQFNWFIRLGWRLYHATYMPQRLTLNQADCIATVSNTSKQEIEAVRLTKRPIIVTYNAPQNLSALLDEPFAPNKTPKNLIYMGSFMEYKNVETLIKGMAQLPGYTLHLLSRIQPHRKQQLEALAPKGSSIIFHNGVSDETYAQLLANQALTVTASLDEGYGIPVADSLALGVPAVISNIPIFHEVAADGAYYFDPRDPQSFAKTVLAASELAAYQDLSQKGKVHSQSFTWTHSAEVLLSEIQQLYAKRQ